MKSDKDYIFQTSNFYRLWTWTRRAFAIIVFVTGIYFINDPDFSFPIKTVLACLITTLFLLKRKDDLAVDKENLYFFQTSIIDSLSKVYK
jgi:Ni,Fe-hydrogenase I cytochrome b subunit